VNRSVIATDDHLIAGHLAAGEELLRD